MKIIWTGCLWLMAMLFIGRLNADILFSDHYFDKTLSFEIPISANSPLVDKYDQHLSMQIAGNIQFPLHSLSNKRLSFGQFLISNDQGMNSDFIFSSTDSNPFEFNTALITLGGRPANSAIFLIALNQRAMISYKTKIDFRDFSDITSTPFDMQVLRLKEIKIAPEPASSILVVIGLSAFGLWNRFMRSING